MLNKRVLFYRNYDVDNKLLKIELFVDNRNNISNLFLYFVGGETGAFGRNMVTTMSISSRHLDQLFLVVSFKTIVYPEFF